MPYHDADEALVNNKLIGDRPIDNKRYQTC